MVERLRGRRLQRRRALFFRQYPLCRHCELRGRTTPATQLDHIVALANGGSDTPDNWQGLCDACHEIKTRQDLGYKTSGACDDDGLPMDPSHPWNQ